MSLSPLHQAPVGAAKSAVQAIPRLLPALLLLSLIALLPATSEAQQATLTDDSTYPAGVSSNQALVVQGASAVKGQPAMAAYVRFKITGSTSQQMGDIPSGTPGADVKKATLRLFVAGVTVSGKFNVYRVTGSWTEDGTSAPTYDTANPIATGVTVPAANAYYSLDVTPLVKQWLDCESQSQSNCGNYGLAFVPDLSTPTMSFSFDSKEAKSTSHQAQLSVLLDHVAVADRFTGSLTGDVTGTQAATVVSSVGGQSAGDVAAAAAAVNVSTDNSVGGTLVRRDAYGNFTAGKVTADLTGNVKGNVTGNLTGNVSGNVTGNLTGDVTGNVSGNLTGNVTGNVSGNAGSVTNGVYTVGDQTVGGTKTFTSPIVGNVSGSASSITGTLDGAKVTGSVALADIATSVRQYASDPPPDAANAGQIILNTTSNHFKISDGAQWKVIGSYVARAESAAMADTANALASTATIQAGQISGKVASAATADSATAAASAAAVTGAVNAAQVSGALANATIGGDKVTGNLGITGNGTFSGSLSAGTVAATTQYNLEGQRVLSVAGSSNLFVGHTAGGANTGFSNTFVGSGAGSINTGGANNTFVGALAGRQNTTGFENSIFGTSAGIANTGGSRNAFFGQRAGEGNVSGSRNSFFGYTAGLSNTTESNNTFIGASSDGAAGITNATALGFGAKVTQSNSLVLGNNASVGIGTSAPQSKLHVVGSIQVEGSGSGVQFADGTVQTTAATSGLASVAHDSTLAGTGASTSPLSVASVEGSKVTGTVANATTAASLSGTIDASQVNGKVASAVAADTANALAASATVNASQVSGALSNATIGGDKITGAITGAVSSGNALIGSSTNTTAIVGKSGPASTTVALGFPVRAGVFGAGDENGVVGSSTSYGLPSRLTNSTGSGVLGYSDQNNGVRGESSNGRGVYGFSISGTGVHGKSDSGMAGVFEGGVRVSGDLTVTGTVSGTVANAQHAATADTANSLSASATIDGSKVTGTVANAATAASVTGTVNASQVSGALANATIGGDKITGDLNVAGGGAVSGSLGVGTTSPQSKLHVVGTMQGAADNLALITGTGGGQLLRLKANDQWAANLVLSSNTRDWVVQSMGNGDGAQNGNLLIFDKTANATRMTINPSGNVGVGVNAPQSKLHVAGSIQMDGTGSGVKFPDGTTQTTAATSGLASVAHDATLTGTGASDSPLGVAMIDASKVTGKVASAATADSANALASSATVGGSQVSGALTNATIDGGKVTGTVANAASANTAGNVSGTVAVLNGGTGATTATAARTNLGAAASGANSDITSLTGLTTLTAPVSAGAAPTASGRIAYDSTANLFRVGVNGAGKTLATTDASITGTASNVTGVVAVANGGTGSSTQNFIDLSTAQTVGGAKTFSSPVTFAAGQTFPGTQASLTAGGGISIAGNTVSNTGVTSLAGTANQVTVSASTGGVTLSLPATVNVNTTGNAATATTANALSAAATVPASQVSGKVATAATADTAGALTASATVNASQVSGALTNATIAGSKITGTISLGGTSSDNGVITGIGNAPGGVVVGWNMNSTGGVGVKGVGHTAGVMGTNSAGGHGVYGESYRGGAGVFGWNQANADVAGPGVSGQSFYGPGVSGTSSNSAGIGVYGGNYSGGLAGKFDGNVTINGGLTVTGTTTATVSRATTADSANALASTATVLGTQVNGNISGKAATAGAADTANALASTATVGGGQVSGALTNATIDASRITGSVASIGVPVGTMVAYGGPVANIPSGWHVCDGTALSRASFPSLFAAISTSWGAGDGSTTFNLPDLRGMFLRGVDAGAGQDPNATTRTAAKPGGNTGDKVGTVQSDLLKNHTHSYWSFGYERSGDPPHIPVGDPESYDFNNANTGTVVEAGVAGAETRPKNAGVYWIIKVQ
jgi:trimeric autotransporter adhesin